MSDFFSMAYLPALDDEFLVNSSMSTLPPVHSYFFVPRLVDKPQNPIMDTLKRTKTSSFANLPPEIVQIAADSSEEFIFPPTFEPMDLLWVNALARKTGLRSQILSWDNLHPSNSKAASRTGFLSEQTSDVFASARHHLQPRLHDQDTDVIHVLPHVLWENLKMTIFGTSSQLHTWDPLQERFVLAGLRLGRRSRLLIDGKDEIISHSVLLPFMRIGNLLRRMESLLTALRSRAANEGPTIHAFAHALSTVLIFLRDTLAQSPLAKNKPDDILSARLTTYYGHHDNVLTALAEMCGVGDDTQPSSYEILDSEPQPLLSRIYNYLHLHMERQSEKTIVALLAYLLSRTSTEYLAQVSRSVGFGGHHLPKSTRVAGERPSLYADEREDDAKEDNIFELIESADEDHFPSFFPKELVKALPAARKSLILLRAAQPDHSLLTSHSQQDEVRWFWKVEEILDEEVKRTSSVTVVDANSLAQPTVNDDDPFAQFKVFDLEPGVHIGPSCFDQAFTTSSTETLHSFVSSFPDKLPLLTPTLSHLTELVFRPLLLHASTLSSALLSLFLAHSTPLNLHTHMALLQSYLLLASPEFKSRLNAALFSDHQDTDYDEHTRNPMSVYALRRRHAPVQRDSNVWAVGLATTLLDRDSWPPVGADLSFFLRTVIVDTFSAAMGNQMEGLARQGALEDLDNRLGFAIRDLPTGRGKDRWLNPLSIEALDFLYMDYKPPHPLEVLITPEILAKYQRIFTFLLRLARVESAMGAVFRMTRPSDKPLFPTLAAPRKLLLHLRFVCQSLVSSLGQYTTLTAIGGNFDAFLARLSVDPEAPSLLWDGRPSGFADVFELARAHSELLDNILSACLMRSTQRSAGDALRDVLELVLEFAILVGKMKRGQIEEYDAGPMVEELHARSRRRMGEMVNMLRAMVDKNVGTDSGAMSSASSLREGSKYIRQPPGGMLALSHLLIRWDMSDWWASK